MTFLAPLAENELQFINMCWRLSNETLKGVIGRPTI